MIVRFAVALAAIAVVCVVWARSIDIPAPAGVPPAARASVESPAAPPVFAQRVTYTGHWEIRRNSGALPGRVSARSFHAGDAMTLVYRGERARMYGVAGPRGGTGVVVVPGSPPSVVDFFAVSRVRGRLIYSSPVQPAGIHSLSVVVSQTHHGVRTHGYVNVEAFVVDGRPG